MRRGRPVHLLVVGLTWPPETFVGWKLEGLARRGMRVSAAAVVPSDARGHALDGVELVRQPHWAESRRRMLAGLAAGALRLLLRSPRSLVGAVRAARSPVRESTMSPRWGLLYRLRAYVPLAHLRPDIVHFEWNSAAIQFLPLTAVWGCPATVSCHGSDVNVRPHLHDRRFARWLRASFGRVDAVHCVSQAVAGAAADLGANPDRTWLIPPGVDPDLFAPSPGGAPADRDSPARELRALSVGDMRWVKGHTHAVRAVRAARDAGVPVRLAIAGADPREATGEGSDLPRVRAEIERLGLEDAVTLLGPLSSLEVRDRLRESDLLLHTSLSEGLPTAVLEAMACGVPVVTSECGGVREAVDGGVEGFVVPLRAPAAAAAALGRLHADPRLRDRMGRAGRARVLADFTIERQLADFEELYERVAAGEPASRRPVSEGARRAAADARPAPGPDALRLVTVSPLEWQHSLDDAIHAVALLRERGVDCRLRIVGDGPHRGALLFARRQLGVEDRVELVPRTAGWRAELGEADAYVDASVAAGSREAVDAATAAGLPLVAAAGDPDALAAGVIALLARDPHSMPTSRAASVSPRAQPVRAAWLA